MKVYGYSKRENVNEHGLMEMEEISIVASKKRFKEIAEFILKSVEEIEYENSHEHLRYNVEGFKDTEADLIIMVENEK